MYGMFSLKKVIMLRIKIQVPDLHALNSVSSDILDKEG